MPKWQIGHAFSFFHWLEGDYREWHYYKCVCFRCLRLGEISLLEDYPINMLSEASSLTPGWRAPYTCLGIYILDGCFCAPKSVERIKISFSKLYLILLKLCHVPFSIQFQCLQFFSYFTLLKNQWKKWCSHTVLTYNQEYLKEINLCLFECTESCLRRQNWQ